MSESLGDWSIIAIDRARARRFYFAHDILRRDHERKGRRCTCCDELLTIGTPGRITVELTDQLTFRGFITADGSTEHVLVSPGSGDLTIIRFQKPADDHIVLTLDFFDASRRRYGGITRAKMHCQPLAT